jgi:hypothetical protein
MPGYHLAGIEADREGKYEARADMERSMRQAILNGKREYPYAPGT